MPRLAYFDCPTGVAGDMCLGALIHAGVPLDYLQAQLDRLGISDEFQLRVEAVRRNGQAATKLYVEIPGDLEPHRIRAEETHASHPHPHPHPHLEPDPAHPLDPASPTHPEGGMHAHSSHAPSRSWNTIAALIREADLPDRVEAWSLATFENLAIAEATVHGVSLEAVHFHEVGATDAIVDIVGTCIGLDWLGVEAIYCSQLPTGGGTVMTDHGRLPVPTPAVMELWQRHQVPVYDNGIQREMVTPTGAALMTTLANRFGQAPTMQLQQIGLGAGNRNLAIPNILRLWVGQADPGHESTAALSRDGSLTPPNLETIVVLETQIDDLNPQAIAYTLAELLRAGALDAFTQAIGMKKSRTGLLLTVICSPEQVAVCEQIIFRETTTLGIRRSQQLRSILPRQIETVETSYGSVRIKVAGTGLLPNQATHIQPEYEDCAALARQHQVAWREIHRLALQAWDARSSTSLS